MSTPTEARPRGSLAGSVVAVVLQVVVTGFLAFLAMMALPFATDACYPGSTAFVCTSPGTDVVAFLPPGTALLGFLISGIALMTQPPGRRGVLICLGWAAGFSGVVIAWLLAAQA